MKLISWNIAGRLSCVNKQIRNILDGNFDIICLQEVISKAEVSIVKQFKSSGYNSINSVPNSSLPNKGKHKYNLLIISKADIKPTPPFQSIKGKEKYITLVKQNHRHLFWVEQSHIHNVKWPLFDILPL